MERVKVPAAARGADGTGGTRLGVPQNAPGVARKRTTMFTTKSILGCLSTAAVAALLFGVASPAMAATPAPVSAAASVSASKAAADLVPFNTVIPKLSQPREPAGQYVYTCYSSNGSSYTMQTGVKLATCHGTQITQFISGKYVMTIKLVGPTVHTIPPRISIWCYISVAGVGFSVLTLADGASFVGLGFSIAGLSSCVA